MKHAIVKDEVKIYFKAINIAVERDCLLRYIIGSRNWHSGIVTLQPFDRMSERKKNQTESKQEPSAKTDKKSHPLKMFSLMTRMNASQRHTAVLLLEM